MNSLGTVMMQQGDLENARTMYQEALKIMEAQLGAEHPNTLTTKGLMALTMHKQGDFQASRELNEQIIRVEEAQLGAQHPNTLNTKQAIATIATT